MSNYEEEIPDDISDEEADTIAAQHESYLNQLITQSTSSTHTPTGGATISGAARNIDRRDIPSNLVTPTKTPCYKSFKKSFKRNNKCRRCKNRSKSN